MDSDGRGNEQTVKRFGLILSNQDIEELGEQLEAINEAEQEMT